MGKNVAQVSMTRVTVKHRQEPPASGRYGMEMARSCLPSCRQLGGRGRDPGQGRPQAVAERCERSEHPCRGVAEDALQLGTATPMQASRGTGGYLSVWSSISALGRLRLTDSMPLKALT